jgi:hypothetical protein
MAKQIELSDQFLSLEVRAEWCDLRQDAYRDYAMQLESALASVKKRSDTAGKYAAKLFADELKAIRAALIAVPSIELERAALKAALRAADEARAAIDAATDVDALIRARADAELKDRAVTAAFPEFSAACGRARLPGLERFPLFQGRLAALAPISDLLRHAGSLDEHTPGSVTFGESAAVDTALGHAAVELNVVPWIIAKVHPESLTFKLWLFHVARRHKVGAELGAPIYREIFPVEAAE